VNCTYYDALGRDDRCYLLARALQFFLPGIPQVYYVGLLAGHNDMELLERSGVGRDINRHYYSRAQLDAELTRPVVQSLCALIRLRNEHPAFQGSFRLGESSISTVQLCWTHEAQCAELLVDFSDASYQLRVSDAGRLRDIDLLAFH
jgi:sucrose phosphorylase